MSFRFRRAAVLTVTALTCVLLFKSTQWTVAGRAMASEANGRDKAYNGKRHISQQPLQQITLEQQLAYQFPYDADSEFPPYIWQTWKYTPLDKRFDEVFVDAHESWTQLHPGSIHNVVTDAAALNLIRLLYAPTPQVIAAYEALPVPVLKADFFRYLVLLAQGGIYSDIDTAALKSAAEWIPPQVPRTSFGLVIGIEADPVRDDWHEWYARRIQFCQWTIQAKSGHPALRSVVANITMETLKRKAKGTLKKAKHDVIEFTGPALWTDHVFAYLNDGRYFDKAGKGALGRDIDWREFTLMTDIKKVGDVMVLPITGFSPGVQQMGSGDDDDPMACVKHGFFGTWKPEYLRHIGEQPAEDQVAEQQSEEEMRQQELLRQKYEEEEAEKRRKKVEEEKARMS